VKKILVLPKYFFCPHQVGSPSSLEMSKKLQEEKRLKKLRDLMSRPENKRCADCLEKGPTYLSVNFGTFVCTTCAGVQ
jgi:hypothetical protein